MFANSCYKHLFFDFDGTLWDIKANSKETIFEMAHSLQLGLDDMEQFFESFHSINVEVWRRFQLNEIDQTTLRILRFEQLLAQYDLAPGLAKVMADSYILQCPLKRNLVPGTVELLSALRPHFNIHILTNGFDEIQPIKIASCGLESLIDALITPGLAQASKPELKMFDYALRITGATKLDALMIGDDLENDIVGAKQAGWDQVYFEGESLTQQLTFKPTYHIKDLMDLIPVLMA